MRVLRIWRGILCLELTCSCFRKVYVIVKYFPYTDDMATTLVRFHAQELYWCSSDRPLFTPVREITFSLVHMQYAIYTPMPSALYHSWTILLLIPGQGCINFSCQVAWAFKLCMVVPNICGPSVINFMSLLWHLEFEIAPTFLETLCTTSLGWILVLQKILRHLAAVTLYSTLYMCTDAVHMWSSDMRWLQESRWLLLLTDIANCWSSLNHSYFIYPICLFLTGTLSTSFLQFSKIVLRIVMFELWLFFQFLH